MDRDECSIPLDLCIPVRAARALIRALELVLHPQLSHCDELVEDAAVLQSSKSSAIVAKRVMHLCRQFVISILQGSEVCRLEVEDGEERIVLFDEVLFLQQHVARMSFRPSAVAKLFDRQQQLQKDKTREESGNLVEAGDDTLVAEIKSLLPATTAGAKDFEKLLRSLMRTQSFSLFLTS